MSVKQPSEMSALFGKLYNDRNKSALLDLYAPEAVFTFDGTAMARGKSEIEKAVAPFFDQPLKISIRCASCYETGDTALVQSDWTLTAPDGSVARKGMSAEVLRRGADGLWRFILDDATFASRTEPGK